MQVKVQDGATAGDLPLAFDGPLLIVGGGRIVPGVLRDMAARAVGLVGADSGGDAIADAGLVPDAVIGDMDSLSDPARFDARTRLVFLAEQDTTDFEKCLYATQAPLTIAMGMTGGRFDHTLATLHAMARYGTQRRIVLVDEGDAALAVSGAISLTVGRGARVSIYPLGRTQFARSLGLRHKLDGLVLEQGGRIGTSNVAVEDTVYIEPAEGAHDPWLLILDLELVGLFL